MFQWAYVEWLRDKVVWQTYLFHPEDEGSMFLQNIGNDLPDYMVSHPRRQ
jgi:hypothetical protein